MPHWNVKVISQTPERYISLDAYTRVDQTANGKDIMFKLKFIDSYQFLTSSLERLTASLDTSALRFATRVANDHPGIDRDIFYGKGVFPYGYLDSEDRLDETALSPKADFFDTLSNSLRITDEKYATVQMAFLQFNCRTFGDYMHKCLELDVRLLADVFENFRLLSISDTDLDSANFITLPQYTFSAAFLNLKIDFLTDAEMYSRFEAGIRGGMTFVNRHFIEAKNPYVGDCVE